VLVTESFLILSLLVWLAFYYNIWLALWGILRARKFDRSYSRNDPTRFIIQICTSGKAPGTINAMLTQIRGYHLRIPYETWVVAEPYDHSTYHADRVVIVPREFRVNAAYKARALEYARRLRIEEGIEGEGTKILFLDDDSFPEREYIEFAFHASFDVGQGFVRTDRFYGKNLLTSIADNFRVVDCLATCATFASMGRPVIVHGEGLVAKGNVEREITWEWGGAGSWGEDFLFGTNAARKFKFGFIPYAVHDASPFSIRDLYRQRRRWFWATANCLNKTDRWRAAFMLSRFYGGLMALPSMALLGYALALRLEYPLLIKAIFTIGTVGFVGYYLYGAWLNTRKWQRVVQTLFLFWVSAIVEAFALYSALLFRPKTFEVIQKEDAEPPSGRLSSSDLAGG